MTPPIVNILNTVAAAAADVTLASGVIRVPNVAGFPSIEYLNVKSSNVNNTTISATAPVFAAGIKRAQKEQPTSITITAATANSTKYAFTIEQNVADSATGVSRLQVIPISFTTDSTATDAELGTGLVSAINGSSSLRVTASYTAAVPGTVVVVVVAQPTANGGSAIFSVVPQSGVTVAATENTTLSAAIVAGGITNATPRQVNAAAHGLINGQKIIITGLTGAGAADVNGIPFQVQYVSPNAFNLVGSSASGAVVAGAAKAFLPGQEPFGQYADVLQSLVAAGVTTAPVTTDQYAQLNLVYNTDDNDLLNTQRQDFNQAILWINQGSAVTGAVLPANYSTLEAAVNGPAGILGGGGSAYLAVPAP